MSISKYIVFIIVFILFIINAKASDLDKLSNQLHFKEQQVDNILNQLADNIKLKHDDNAYLQSVNSLNEEIYFYIFLRDSLVYWSSNQLSIDGLEKKGSEVEFKNLGNSLCEIRSKVQGDYIIKGVIIIKYNYPYLNKYLVNNYFNGGNYSFQIKSLNSTNNKLSSIYSDYKGNSLFKIYDEKASQNSNDKIFQQLLFLVFPLLLFFILFYLIVRNQSFTYYFISIIFIVFLVVGISFCNHNILNIQLLNPTIFAWSSIIPSLGHLYIYILCLGFLTIIAFNYLCSIKRHKIFNNKISFQYLILLIGIILKVILLYCYYKWIEIIISNSGFSIDLSDVFSLNFYSLIVIAIVFVLSMSIAYFYYYIDLIISYLQCKMIQLVILMFSLIIAIISYLYFGFVFAIVMFFILSYRYINYKKKFSDSRNIYFLGFLVFISGFTIFSFNKINYLKEHEYRITYANKISSETDPLIEFSFCDLTKILKQNDSIKRILKHNKREQLLGNYLNKEVLKGYWDKYDITLTLCSNQDILFIKPQNIEINCRTYFNNKSKQIGIPTKFSNLFLLEYGNYKTNYLGFIELENATIYLEFSSKKGTMDLAYPKLLIDEKYSSNTSNYKYSYAKYVHGKLVSHSGNYFYNQELKLASKKLFFLENNYSHYHYKYDSSTDYLVSKSAKKFVSKLAPFTILLFLFFVLFQLTLCICYPSIVLKWIKQFTFKNRLQVTIILIILLSFVSIGYWSINYIKILNDEKSKDILTEKTHSIILELQSKIKNNPELFKNKEELEGNLVKYSNIFFTDINIYNTYGKVIASSRAKIFDEALLSRMMNRTAFEGLSIEKRTIFIQKEKIGKLEYWSAYMPLRNSNEEILGYINLPYYARQTDLQEELSGFISAFLNIYFVIIGLSVVIVLLISNYIVRPLNIIKEHIGTLSISKKNEKIIWKKDDEIGALVTEYNRMVDELVKSAEMLVQSEREGAWREMAKQVAHEIKNPLTPMRLSIQNLYRAWEDKAPDWESRFIRFKDMALEQIDTLSVIASEFSNFAKMPYPQKQQIDLIKIISSVVDLFKDFPEKEIIIKTEINQVLINADKDQILRIFTNLIKNSMQALDEIDNAKINITIEKNQDNVIIKISDNGHGISEEMKDKIFQVNFTTRSGGTGLGLAMVKNIIENHGGKIHFESTPYLETIFIIELPIYI